LPLEKECKICGKYRTISFAPFEFHEKKSIKNLSPQHLYLYLSTSSCISLTDDTKHMHSATMVVVTIMLFYLRHCLPKAFAPKWFAMATNFMN
jgi:hypothetical protein